MKRRVAIVAAAVIALGVFSLSSVVRAEAPTCSTEQEAICYQPSAEKLIELLTKVTEPNIAVPIWLKAGQ